MKFRAPDYYDRFHCIASACRHSCCVGWEIDIDPDSFRHYMAVSGPFGDKLRKNIREEEGTASFCLDERERCPFLQGNGLCELYRTLGEEALCDICTEHPRFYQELTEGTEAGLGMCCEEAARLILFHSGPVCLTEEEDGEKSDTEIPEEEAEALAVREELFSILQDRNKTIGKRCKDMLSLGAVSFPQKTPAQWTAFFLSLEQLDASWGERLYQAAALPGIFDFPDKEYEEIYENILYYFVYRHFIGGLEDGRYYERLAFAVLSLLMIRLVAETVMAEKGCIEKEDWVEAARLYSSEIEYSEENTDAVLRLLSRQPETEDNRQHSWIFSSDFPVFSA